MATNNKGKLPHECTSITEVRNEIDRIDAQLIQLLGERFGYVREVVKYKEKNDKAVEASDRRKTVIDSRRQWAEQQGIDPDVIEQIYNTLIDYFIAEEKKLM